MTDLTPIVRDLGRADYTAVARAMRELTRTRDAHTPDEIWFVEHPAVYTAGRDAAQRGGHIAGVPLIAVERGGDITFHAPGQMVVYPLLDLLRRHLFVKPFVRLLLHTLIDTLGTFGIRAFAHETAPGVYVAMPGGVGAFEGMAKIASIGIHVSRGCSFHGIALNVNTDLAGFRRIAPCGYAGLRMTDMASLGAAAEPAAVRDEYRRRLLVALDNALQEKTTK